MLSFKKTLALGGALFAMHFGASCMLYPVHWGKQSGSDIFIAFFGILLTALILPLLAYVALSRGNGNFRQITSRVSPRFGSAFCVTTVILLGPLFVVPRMSAASWDAIVQFIGWAPDSKIPLIIFNIFYYILTYWFVSSKSTVMDKISKILFPILIVIVSAVILKGLITPISDSWAPRSYEQPPFVYGFLEGYSTADLLCSLLFGLVVITGLENAGVTKDKMNRNIVKIGVVGIGMLTCTHLGHMLVGANVGNAIDLTYAQLYAEVVRTLWGNVGGLCFSIALVAAALTTAIGLTSSAAEYMEESTEGKISYRNTAIVTCLLSIVISSIGLDSIITFITPLLDAVYPGAIVLVLFYVFMPGIEKAERLYACRISFYSAIIFGAFDVVATYCRLLGSESNFFMNIYKAMPLSSYKLTWVIAAVVFYVVGLLLAGKQKKAA